jgi:hypothetical protein
MPELRQKGRGLSTTSITKIPSKIYFLINYLENKKG